MTVRQTFGIVQEMIDTDETICLSKGTMANLSKGTTAKDTKVYGLFDIDPKKIIKDAKHIKQIPSNASPSMLEL